ncbi:MULTISPECIES: hypothetical protein [Citrobacter]|uniref:hypothetical protein n=1 Tax=Citrobacter TaxID=544 RepID=UPI000FDC11DF|nr:MULTISPECIES: hypothetical protein [Citrobacter]ELK6101895.1 hypothetical protein [Citrobacter freundii]MDM3197551.1 hypothetical protein [Citrobacter sp. Cf095]MDT7298043.1 hypothetical protein [Citrobacter freundii]MDT7361272.1 hypothetical protein [Citrobacter freundii]MDT7417716.1 hypothetical protein [Citrobacter freundii]
MVSEFVINEELWKPLVTALPLLGAFWACCQHIFQFLKNGKLVRLRYFFKEYGEHLSDEDKKLITNILRNKVMAQVVGITNKDNREKLIYIMNRCDLNMSKGRLSVLSAYLKYDGRYFYFYASRKYKIKKAMSWFTGVLYLAYGLAPGYTYQVGVFGDLSMPATFFISFICIFISVFLFSVYPSSKKMQGINGKMLKVNGYAYREK